MYVPAFARQVLPAESPVHGSVAAIDVAAAFVQDVVNDCTSYKESLNAASEFLGTGESGAVVKLQGKVTTHLIPGATSLSSSAQAAKKGFNTYAAAVDRIHGDAGKVKGHIEDHLEAIRTQAGVVEDILRDLNRQLELQWEAPPSAALPEPVLDPQLAEDMDAGQQDHAKRAMAWGKAEEWSRAVRAWGDALDGIDSECTKWKNLIEERGNEEQALLRTLRDTDLGQLIAVGSAAGAPGPKATIATALSGELRGVPQQLTGELVTLQQLLEGDLSPEEVAQAWQRLKDAGVDTDALLREYCFEFANLDGLPFADMDKAGRAALEYALDPDHPEHLQEAFARMGFNEGDRSLTDFEKDLEAVRSAVREAEGMVDEGDTVQLVALGQHDGAATAGISMGDLDTAATVGVFVSGMNSDVRGISDVFDAFHEIRLDDPSIAMLTWVGYRSPSLASETAQARADSGGERLAAFLDGIAVQRSDNPIERFVVLGHSYGTNVIAEALKLSDAPVDAVVTIGSAGLKVGTTREDLGVEELYTTHAAGDNIARAIGQPFHFSTNGSGAGPLQNEWWKSRVDPADLDGAIPFTSERTPDGRAVTMHNLVTPIEHKWPGEQWIADIADGTAAADEIGYLNPEASTVKGLFDIMRGSL